MTHPKGVVPSFEVGQHGDEVVLFGPTLALTLTLAAPDAGASVSAPSAPPPAEAAPPSASPPVAAPPSAAAPAPAPASPPAAATPPASAPAELAQPPGDKPPTPPSPRQPPPPEAVSAEPAVAPAPVAPHNLRDPFDPVATETVPTETITIVHHRSVPPPPPPPPAYHDDHDQDDFFVSGFGGPSMRLTSVNRKVGMTVGFRGGLLLGKRLSIGAAYYNLRRRFGPPIRDDDDNAMALKMAYGGALLGITVVRHENLELNIQSLFGAGKGCVSYNVKPTNYAHGCVESVKMFVAEPEAVFNVNVSDWMRMGFTVGYRVVVRERWSPPNDFNLSGAHMGVNFDFGWFAR
jgi:hypothetical protein